MKKVVVAAAAFLAAVAPCSMFFASIEPVRAFANEATLTTAQTRALFGDRLDGEYHPTKTGALTPCTFEYYADGVVSTQSADATFPYVVTQKNVIVYRSPANFTFYNDGYNAFNIRLCPSVSLANLHYFRMSMGASTSSVDPSIPSGASTLSRQCITLSTDFYNGTMAAHDYTSLKIQNGTSYYEATISVDVLDGSDYLGTPNTSYFTFNPIVLDATNQSSSFSVVFFERYFANYGYKRNLNFDKPVNIANTSGFDDYYYLFIECPLLSDDYVDNNASSGGGSDSGSDSPDYSGDLQDILDQLDTIVLQNQYIISQNSSIENELALGNDKLNQNNSKLDQVNSNLNKIDSHIQQLQIPDLMSQSSGDMSHIAQNESKNSNDLRAADANQQVINSVAGYGDVSLPNLDNVHSMPDDFSELWNYTDQDGLSWVNPILYAMPILTLTVGALAYIVFGRAR